MKLIVWLGNPGPEYAKTRHNIGFVAIEELQKMRDFPSFAMDKKYKAKISQGTVDGQKIILCEPQTFMNLSGQSVAPLAHFHKIPVGDICVIHDEIDLQVGTVQYKVGGSHAGHNGLRSIGELMGSLDFTRVRIGVGRPATKEEVSDWVLGAFSVDEKERIEAQMAHVARLVTAFISLGA